MIMKTYVCESRGSQNNNHVKKCDFVFDFEAGLTYHCPICASRLTPKEQKK